MRWTSGVDFNLRYWERRTGQQIGPDDVEPLTWALADQGRSHSAAAYLEAMEYAQAVARDGANWWSEYDLLLTPTMALPPAEIGEIGNGDEENPLMPIVRSTPYAIFTAGFNSSGQPGHLAAAALVGGRPADRDPAGGGLRPRGSAPARGGSARAGTAVGRSAAAAGSHRAGYALTARRYLWTESAPKTAIRPTHHATAAQTSLPAGVPRNSARVASTIVLNGFASANASIAARHRLRRHERGRREREREDHHEPERVGALRRPEISATYANTHENA